MMTHLEVQQRGNIRRDLAERMKFVLPDLRAGEMFFIGKKIRAKSSKDGLQANGCDIIAIQGTMAVPSASSTIFQAKESKIRRPSTVATKSYKQ